MELDFYPCPRCSSKKTSILYTNSEDKEVFFCEPCKKSFTVYNRLLETAPIRVELNGDGEGEEVFSLDQLEVETGDAKRGKLHGRVDAQAEEHDAVTVKKCKHCGAENKIRFRKSHMPNCLKCHQPLFGAVKPEKSKSKNNNRNLYAALDVEEKAALPDIRKAYRRLAMKWHPEKNGHAAKHDAGIFKDAGEAFLVLSNSKFKEEYDISLAADSPYERPEETNSAKIEALFFSEMKLFAEELGLKGKAPKKIQAALVAQGCPESVAAKIAGFGESGKKEEGFNAGIWIGSAAALAVALFAAFYFFSR